MTLQHLNPEPATSTEAVGYMAPYTRVATHIGYCIAWVNSTSDENWLMDDITESGSPEAATNQLVVDDLKEASLHLARTAEPLNAFVNQTQVGLMDELRDQLTWLEMNLSRDRSEALTELQTLADNLAYAAAEFERHVTGNQNVSEGRNA